MELKKIMKKLLLTIFTLIVSLSVFAYAEPIRVVTTFSILGDFVREVGKDKIQVYDIVKAGADAHVFQPSPKDAKEIAKANIIFSNGLGFEGFLERLIKNAKYQGIHVIASEKVNLLKIDDVQGKHEKHDGDNDGEYDPHAWQDIKNAIVYVTNITKGLCLVDKTNCPEFEKNATEYQNKLSALDSEIIKLWADVPANKRKIITSHDAFGYYGRAYGVSFLAPQGINTHTEANAKGVAKLIKQIRNEKITSIFVENINNPRLIKKIADETGVQMSGELYSDSLSENKGTEFSDSYLKMMQQNTQKMINSIK